MTRTNKYGPRSGVSLIEILVVMAIIGILIALTAAALSKTTETQNARTSETQVFKLQQALDQEYDRVVAACARDAANGQIPPEVVSVCDGDPARAKALWTAFQLRLNFPDTFAEATLTPVTILDAAGNAVYRIPRPPLFDAVNGLQPAQPWGVSTFSPEEESGALLYLILAKRSVAGGGAMATSAEDLTQASRRKVSFNGRELETFSDAFKRSVGFRRWEQTRDSTESPSIYNVGTLLNEVQAAPYVDPTKAIGAAPNANRDPLDPQGLMLKWNISPDPTVDKRRIILAGYYQPPGAPTGALVKTGLYFNGQNRMANVYSLGKTKATSAGVATPEDDILGFRLRKQGEKGYKK